MARAVYLRFPHHGDAIPAEWFGEPRCGSCPRLVLLPLPRAAQSVCFLGRPEPLGVVGQRRCWATSRGQHTPAIVRRSMVLVLRPTRGIAGGGLQNPTLCDVTLQSWEADLRLTNMLTNRRGLP